MKSSTNLYMPPVRSLSRNKNYTSVSCVDGESARPRNTEMPYMNSMPILPNNTVRREKKLLTHGVSEDFQDHTVAPIMISQPHSRTSLQLRSGKLSSVKVAAQNQSAKENNYRSAMANQSYLILQQQQKK